MDSGVVAVVSCAVVASDLVLLLLGTGDARLLTTAPVAGGRRR